MQPLFSDTSQLMKSIEQNDNTVVFSSLSEFYQPVMSKGFAVKYVLEGSELYELDQQQYMIHAGSYLLCNSTKQGYVEIESRHKVKGICVNIVPELMLEVVSSMRRPDTSYPDAELGLFFSTPYFPENRYEADKTVLGKALTSISLSIQEKRMDATELGIEFFYSLSEKIIADQLPVFKQLQSLPGIKRQTKRDLYRRICKGKEMIDHQFTQPLTIQTIAREACMSEYHFFRLFKKMTGISPYQYMVNKRLEFAHYLLQQQLPVSAVAIECGFTDIFSFSKAFKKRFKINPSSLQRK